MNLIIDTELYGPVGIIPYPVRASATESLEFKTDVFTSYSATAEERSNMRPIPRHTLSYSYDADYGNMQAIFNAISSNIRGNWLIPLWFENQVFGASIGQTVIDADTTVHDIRADSYVLVFQSNDVWQVAKVNAITSSTVTCEALTFSGRAYLIPLRIGFFSGQASMSPTGFRNGFKGLFCIDDVLTGLTETVTQLNGLDFYTTPYLIDSAGETQVFWDEDQVQFETGNIDRSTPWNFGRYSKQYIWDDNGAAALRNLKNYFYRRAGRFRSFMSPTFENNLRSSSTGNVGTTFKFLDEGYTDNLFAVRKLLGFQLDDGSWLTRTASDAVHLGGGEDQVTLSSALGVNANRITCVSFVCENRLDTDKIDISLNTSDRFRASASVMEISP